MKIFLAGLVFTATISSAFAGFDVCDPVGVFDPDQHEEILEHIAGEICKDGKIKAKYLDQFAQLQYGETCDDACDTVRHGKMIHIYTSQVHPEPLTDFKRYYGSEESVAIKMQARAAQFDAEQSSKRRKAVITDNTRTKEDLVQRLSEIIDNPLASDSAKAQAIAKRKELVEEMDKREEQILREQKTQLHSSRKVKS